MKFRTNLIIILILIGSLPLFVGGGFLFYFFNSYIQNTNYERVKEIGDLISVKTDIFVSDAIKSAELIADNHKLRDKNYSTQERKEALKEISKEQSFFRKISIVNENGETIVSTGEREIWNENPWFLKAKSKEQAIVSDAHIISESKDSAMTVFTPYKIEEEDHTYYIVAQIDMGGLFRIIDTATAARGVVFILNPDGVIIFSSDRDYIFEKMTDDYPLRQNLQRSEGNTQFYFEGSIMDANFRNVNLESENYELNWHLIIARSQEDAIWFLGEMATYYLLLSIAFFLPIILVSFFVSRRVMRPLKNISIAAKRVAKGDFNSYAQIKSKDEFGELAENFNKMVDDLAKISKRKEEEKDILEVKVKARTKELSEINEKLEAEVEKRTEEMEKKIKEYEKMSKMMVGRELKMIELKKELKKAEEKIKRLTNGKKEESFEN